MNGTTSRPSSAEAAGANAADVAVIGGGLAGLCLALSTPPQLRVAVFAKRPLGRAASGWAQGGLAAVVPPDDDFQSHIDDTLAAGDGLCDADAVREIICDAPAAVAWLAAQGVKFNTDEKGDYALTREGGHCRRRILHIGDRSGAAIMDALRAQVAARPNIVVYERHIAVDLVVRAGRCRGFYALDLRGGRVRAVAAGAVVLASGGAGRVYLYSSTPEDATGDGVGMAFRAGCRIANMEFFQFHPTCLYHPQPPTLLISEALRGEGARLVNDGGERFAATIPGGELAARDVVARAIDAEMKKTGADCVYLDCGARPPQFWQERFPFIVEECRRRNVRVPDEMIPVVPAAHYGCGGVSTDLCGRTDIEGLYAIGETADAGLHGANRLASNSLLECVVMARRCAAAVHPQPPEAVQPQTSVDEWDERRISPPPEEIMVAHNWEELRRIMWNYVGIVRSDERLRRARRRVEGISGEIEEYYRRYVVSRDFLELRNLAQCAELIIEGAMARRESRGLHYNLDCPTKAAAARPTELRRADFCRRRAAVNQHCPFSGRLIVAGGMTLYRGHEVGFCNGDCRDVFAAAVKDNFQTADDSLLAARAEIERMIDSQPPPHL